MYSHFCDYLRVWQKKDSATTHFEHLPADKAFVDFTGKKLQFVDHQTGELTEVEVFVAVLVFSGLTYVEATLSQRQEYFIGTCEHALQYFGGVPRALVLDNLKSAVIKADRYEPVLNEA